MAPDHHAIPNSLRVGHHASNPKFSPLRDVGTVVCERRSAPFTRRFYFVLGYVGALIGLSELVLLGKRE
jgi:hypothetical protein